MEIIPAKRRSGAPFDKIIRTNRIVYWVFAVMAVAIGLFVQSSSEAMIIGMLAAHFSGAGWGSYKAFSLCKIVYGDPEDLP